MPTEPGEFELVSREEKQDIENNNFFSVEVNLGEDEQDYSPRCAQERNSWRGSITEGDEEEDEEDAMNTPIENDLNEVLRREDLYPWFNVIIIAVAVGTVEFIPLFFLGISINAKYKFLDHLINSSGLVIMTVANVVFSCLCVVTAALTTRLVPCTAGSGIPSLISYLYNGIKIDRDLLSSQMVMIKMIGVELAIVGGLAVGREGPAIHIGAAIGDLTYRLVNKSIRMYTGKKVPFSGAIKSNVVLMGATCGFASAFRSPIGGMLYCVEEIMTHWDIKSHMSVGAQTFVAASIAAFTTQIILNLSVRSGNISFSSIIIFSEEEANEGTTAAAYHYHDLPGFFITAITCGVLAGLTTRVSNWLHFWQQKKRKQVADSASQWKEILVLIRNAILIATLTTLSFSVIPLVFTDCLEEPDDGYHGNSTSTEDHHRLLSGAGGDRTYVQYTCPEGKYSQLASLSLAGEEGVIRHLLSRDEEEFKVLALVIFLIIYIPISVSNRLLPIPMGSFVPNLLIGSLVGRIVGEALQAIYPSTVTLSAPGVFALLGAGSMLGAWTRTMMAVVVTLLEITGDIGMVSPLIVGVVIARSIATSIADHSYTHELFYALIDDPDSKGPLILHPNDWKKQKKVVNVDTNMKNEDGSFRRMDSHENQGGQRTSVTLATPTGAPRNRRLSNGSDTAPRGSRTGFFDREDDYYRANVVGFSASPSRLLRSQSSRTVEGRLERTTIMMDEDVDVDVDGDIDVSMTSNTDSITRLRRRNSFST